MPVVVDKKVDVFYLYPTSWHKLSPDESNICRIDNPTMLAGAKVAFGKQATAFEPVGNVYAPFYRQIDLSPLTAKNALAAFRPVTRWRPSTTISSITTKAVRSFWPSSQGSNVLINLLAGYLKEHPEPGLIKPRAW